MYDARYFNIAWYSNALAKTHFFILQQKPVIYSLPWAPCDHGCCNPKGCFCVGVETTGTFGCENGTLPHTNMILIWEWWTTSGFWCMLFSDVFGVWRYTKVEVENVHNTKSCHWMCHVSPFSGGAPSDDVLQRVISCWNRRMSSDVWGHDMSRWYGVIQCGFPNDPDPHAMC